MRMKKEDFLETYKYSVFRGTIWFFEEKRKSYNLAKSIEFDVKADKMVRFPKNDFLGQNLVKISTFLKIGKT